MNLNIRITWPAWAWVNSTVDIIASLFAELGYDLISDIEYESRIKWWVNYFDVSISDDGSKFLTKKVDILLAFNAESLEKALASLKENATIITNKKNSEKLSLKLNSFNVLDLEIADKYDNTYLLAILAKYLNIDLDIILEKIENVFARKWEVVVNYNKAVVENIYKTYEVKTSKDFEIKRIWEVKNISYWNKAITKGAIASELEFFAAYPMTPASTILTEVIKDWSVTYIQNEDEIAVANSTIWASFTWARAMCATSGWGFALWLKLLVLLFKQSFQLL